MEERSIYSKTFIDDLHVTNEHNFSNIVLRLFQIQSSENKVYQSYLNRVGIDPPKITAIDQIPFLPISFFKSHRVTTGDWHEEAIFNSSGTTGFATSRHFVKNTSFYLQHAQKLFEQEYGPLTQYHLLALLPSYHEREGSSLIAMIDWFIKKTNSDQSGFYLYNQADLLKKINDLKTDSRTTLVWGVSFALLDLAEKFEIDLSHTIVMETGGMKGRRKEWVREELHDFLCRRFNVAAVHSEYGMTELLSQAYSKVKGVFRCPNSMRIVVKESNDPFTSLENGKTGSLCVIDLANEHSCAFIQTQDLGRIVQDGYFEVLGRMDNSDVRGCNLLVG